MRSYSVRGIYNCIHEKGYKDCFKAVLFFSLKLQDFANICIPDTVTQSLLLSRCMGCQCEFVSATLL